MPSVHHFYGRNAGFHEAENSTVHGHVVVLLDGEYIDLTLDQFDEYPDYIPYEPVESDGQIGKLLRNIMKHEDQVKPARLISMVAKSCMPGYAIPPTKCWQQIRNGRPGNGR